MGANDLLFRPYQIRQRAERDADRLRELEAVAASGIATEKDEREMRVIRRRQLSREVYPKSNRKP